MRRLRGCCSSASLLCFLVAGCGEELGAERFPTAVVRGTLRMGAKPLNRGWVEFLPVDGTRGNVRSARIGPDGSFLAEGVAVGRNQIGVANAPIDPQSTAIFQPLRSPVRRTIPPGDSAVSIDLLVEKMKNPNSP